VFLVSRMWLPRISQEGVRGKASADRTSADVLFFHE